MTTATINSAQKVAYKARQRLGLVKVEQADTRPDIVEWGNAHFYLYDTQERFHFYPSQAAGVREAMRRKSNGDYVYNTVLWSWMKKSAKSTVIALVADYIATHKPRAQIKLIGNDLKQADSRVGFYMRENIKLGAKVGTDAAMRDFRNGIKISKSSYLIEYPNGSIVEMIPVDAGGEAGGNDDMIVYSELWAWKNKSHQNMWAEMTLSSTKFGRSQRWIDTYAGFKGESPVLEQLYESIVSDENRLDLEWPYEPCEAYATQGNFAVWVTVPHLPWQTDEYYASEEVNLTPQQYARMHRNQWAESSDQFVDAIWWDACHEPDLRMSKDASYVMAVDAGVSNDCFAIVVAGKRTHQGDDGQLIETVTVPLAKVYVPDGESLDFSVPEAFIRQVCSEYNVYEITYDPYQLHDMMTRLKRDRVARVRDFPQGGDRAKADKGLRDAIINRRIVHNGDVVLREHILNANAEINKDENKLRLVKRNANMKIDSAVALSMAAYRALRLRL